MRNFKGSREPFFNPWPSPCPVIFRHRPLCNLPPRPSEPPWGSGQSEWNLTKFPFKMTIIASIILSPVAHHDRPMWGPMWGPVLREWSSRGKGSSHLHWVSWQSTCHQWSRVMDHSNDPQSCSTIMLSNHDDAQSFHVCPAWSQLTPWVNIQVAWPSPLSPLLAPFAWSFPGPLFVVSTYRHCFWSSVSGTMTVGHLGLMKFLMFTSEKRQSMFRGPKPLKNINVVTKNINVVMSQSSIVCTILINSSDICYLSWWHLCHQSIVWFLFRD